MKVVDRILSMDSDNQIHLNEGECCFIAPYEVDEFNKSKEYDKTFHLFVKANSKDRRVTVNIFKSIDHESTILAMIGAVLNDNNKHELVSIQYSDDSTFCLMSQEWCRPVLDALSFIAAQYATNSRDKDKIMKLSEWIKMRVLPHENLASARNVLSE